MRVKIILAYDGSRYSGFQIQSHTTNTVAHDLYEALKALHITCTIHASGRTDKGVHATGQVIHIDLPYFWKDLKKLKAQLKYKLPATLLIKSITEVSEQFHARYSAKKRSYRYILSDHNIGPFKSAYITHCDPIDTEIFQKALNCFVGEHDFCYFQKTGSSAKTTTRKIYKATLYQYKEYYIVKLTANGFLRSQVRMIIAAALAVSKGKLSLAQLQEQIDAKKQHITKLAPASGLYLSRITYA